MKTKNDLDEIVFAIKLCIQNENKTERNKVGGMPDDMVCNYLCEIETVTPGDAIDIWYAIHSLWVDEWDAAPREVSSINFFEKWVTVENIKRAIEHQSDILFNAILTTPSHILETGFEVNAFFFDEARILELNKNGINVEFGCNYVYLKRRKENE